MNSSCIFEPYKCQLYARLVATVDSEKFLNEIKSLNEASKDGISYEFPFREATGFFLSYFLEPYIIHLLVLKPHFRIDCLMFFLFPFWFLIRS